MKGGVPLFCVHAALPHATRFFFFTRAQIKRPFITDTWKNFPPCIPCRAVREASLRSTTSQRAVHTLWYRPALRCSESVFDVSCASPACLYARRQRPLFVSDTITARSAPRGGQTQAGRTSEPTASPYHNGCNDRHGEPAPRSRRRPAATQGGKVIPREGAKLTHRHGYDVRTPRRTAMRARNVCSETAAHTQRPHATSHRKAEPPPQAPKGSAR